MPRRSPHFDATATRLGIAVQAPLRKALAPLMLALLAGCQSYHAAPLPDAPDFAATDKAPVPATPLSLVNIASLAVRNNPNLVASRGRADIAEAQSFAAGLLPDPQLSLSGDQPVNPSYVNAYLFGLSEDLQRLLTYPSRRDAAKASADQAKLTLLWDEWQTIEMAGTLAVTKFYNDAKAERLSLSADLLKSQSARSSSALAAGNATIDMAGANLAAALDTVSLQNQAQRAALTADTGLRQLLNAAPNTALSLADPADPAPVSEVDLKAALVNVAKTRPDLLALQAGYHAQEEVVRQSILEQFPSIILGGNRQSDTSNVLTSGLSLQVSLPIFDGGRGNIRIQGATRAVLRAEYQARLDQTTNDAWRLWKEINLLQSELAALSNSLPEFRRMANLGQEAYANGDLPPATFVVLQTSLTARESEYFDLKIALWSDTLALHTLLGMPFISPPQETLQSNKVGTGTP